MDYLILARYVFVSLDRNNRSKRHWNKPQHTLPVHPCHPSLCSDTGPPLEQRHDILLSLLHTWAEGQGWSVLQWCSDLCTVSGFAHSATALHLHKYLKITSHKNSFWNMPFRDCWSYLRHQYEIKLHSRASFRVQITLNSQFKTT